MKKIRFIIALLTSLSAIILAASCTNEPVITFRSLLKEMADPESITRFPDRGYQMVQFSSHDRQSIHPDSAGWFANNDYTQFIREESNEGRHEYVMLEAEGPGAIVRWWMTFGNANALNSYVRVYIDGHDSPVIEGMAPDLVGRGLLAPDPLSAAVSPLTGPQRQGYNLYLPIPFSEKCKITLENDSVVITPQRRTPSIYYNIGARLYEKGTRIVSLKKEMLTGDTLAISECARTLLSEHGTESSNELQSFSSGKYAPGEAGSVKISKPGFAVSRFTLKLAGDDTAAALKQAIIRMRFDGKETVEVPAGSENTGGTGLHTDLNIADL